AAATITTTEALAADQASELRPRADTGAAMPDDRSRASLRRAVVRDDRSPGRALRAALATYAREDYVDAARQFTRLARSRDIEAQYRLGLLYAQNKGVLGNIGDAIVWYRRAAEQGHVEAQYQLSLAHFFGGHAHWDVPRWYDSAAEIDKSAADSNLELIFPNGIGVPQDYSEALRWSRAAAEQGHVEAMARTRTMYGCGMGCEADYAEAG